MQIFSYFFIIKKTGPARLELATRSFGDFRSTSELWPYSVSKHKPDSVLLYHFSKLGHAKYCALPIR